MCIHTCAFLRYTRIHFRDVHMLSCSCRSRESTCADRKHCTHVLSCYKHCTHVHTSTFLRYTQIHSCDVHMYGVATISRLLEIIGFFCKRALQRDDILGKRPIIVRSVIIVGTPYLCIAREYCGYHKHCTHALSCCEYCTHLLSCCKHGTHVVYKVHMYTHVLHALHTCTHMCMYFLRYTHIHSRNIRIMSYVVRTHTRLEHCKHTIPRPLRINPLAICVRLWLNHLS